MLTMATVPQSTAAEAFRIPNGTGIEFPNGWVGLVVDQNGPDVSLTYAHDGETYSGIVVVPRDQIQNRKVIR